MLPVVKENQVVDLQVDFLGHQIDSITQWEYSEVNLYYQVCLEVHHLSEDSN